MEKNSKNVIKDLSLEFSLQLIDFELKIVSKKTAVNPNQVLRSGTAIGAMIREAQGAESRRDFIHKMKIAFKEAEETEYWLLLLSKSCPLPETDQLLELLVQIKKILSKIISTSIVKSKAEE